jgi:hypothetical protein
VTESIVQTARLCVLGKCHSNLDAVYPGIRTCSIVNL